MMKLPQNSAVCSIKPLCSLLCNFCVCTIDFGNFSLLMPISLFGTYFSAAYYCCLRHTMLTLVNMPKTKQCLKLNLAMCNTYSFVEVHKQQAKISKKVQFAAVTLFASKVKIPSINGIDFSLMGNHTILFNALFYHYQPTEFRYLCFKVGTCVIVDSTCLKAINKYLVQ